MGPPPGASPRVKPVGEGPTPMRMTASWSGSNDPTAYKSVTRDPRQGRAPPRIISRTCNARRPTPQLQKAHLAGHPPSACSGVKALRNTSAARRQAAKLCYRFGPLTPSARSANLIAGDGTKNDFPAPNKEPPTNPLDRKSAIQVRIRLPPAPSIRGSGTWFSAGERCRLIREHRKLDIARSRGAAMLVINWLVDSTRPCLLVLIDAIDGGDKTRQLSLVRPLLPRYSVTELLKV